jgi:hypothetical protein
MEEEPEEHRTKTKERLPSADLDIRAAEADSHTPTATSMLSEVVEEVGRDQYAVAHQALSRLRNTLLLPLLVRIWCQVGRTKPPREDHGQALY